MSTRTVVGFAGGPLGRAAALAVVYAAVATLWAATLWLAPPQADFPLNDDWIYARAVKDWMETGHYTGHPFATATLVGQAGWGRLFCAVFGFSFNTLRWSTLILWLVGALAITRAALFLRAAPPIAGLAGALVIANPLAMNLGYTFMTDVPFMTVSLLAGHYYLRALRDPAWPVVFAGSLLAAWALAIRQFAVLVPMAFLVAMTPLLYRMGRREATRIVLATTLPLAVTWGMLRYLAPRVEQLHHPWNPSLLGESAVACVAGATKFYGIALVYLGLFILPLTLGAAAYWVRHKAGSVARRCGGFAAVLGLLLATVCWSAPRRLPYLGNLLYDTGVGPMTIKGVLANGGQARPLGLGNWWWIPTMLGLLAAAWMIAAAIRWFILIPGDGRRPVRDPRRRQQVFLMLWAVLMVVALYQPWLPVRFDRYLLGALAPVLLLLAMAYARPSWRMVTLQVLLLGSIYAFSLVSLQDYLAWNTARWNVVDRLMGEGVPPEDIDGGYEFNGWYTSPSFIERDGPWAFYQSGSLGWWAVRDTWMLAWSPRPDFDVVETIPCNSWLFGDARRILLLKRHGS